LHGHDGHHGGGGRQGHAARPGRGGPALHRAAGSAARGDGLAVADARLRCAADPSGVLSSARNRSDRSVVATLSVEDLAVEFGGVAALAGVSFDVRPGTITSLIGPNGAGKTTAFNAITGYLRPRRGRVAWDGAPLTGSRPCDIARRGIVRTFQKTSVFPALSVRDNVMVGLHLRGGASVLAILGGRRAVREEEARLAAEAESV